MFINHRIDICYMLAATLLVSLSPVRSEDSLRESGFDCTNELNLRKLCVNRLQAHCVQLQELVGKKINADEIRTKKICVEDSLSVSEISATEIQSQNACVTNFKATAACVGALVAHNACVAGSLVAADLKPCAKYAAALGFRQGTTYQLGTLINWDLIVDDPNGDVSLTPFSSYKAPETGYYIVSMQIDQLGLQGANAIVGAPITNIVLQVNGVPNIQAYVPYLSFHDAQNGNVSSLVLLQKGDILTTKYNVFVLTDSAGFTPYNGTVAIKTSSFFRIHLLSITCPNEKPCGSCEVSPSGCQASPSGCIISPSGCQVSVSGQSCFE